MAGLPASAFSASGATIESQAIGATQIRQAGPYMMEIPKQDQLLPGMACEAVDTLPHKFGVQNHVICADNDLAPYGFLQQQDDANMPPSIPRPALSGSTTFTPLSQ
ncbi:hypothetical protein K469DRAFT_749672 [Zopfia rhizophila CBS 207.26]|uniref:Uncharacterized protein n=1 Tax=Zopfia rhizophila CBS 207.26 TaxID=1314779 RepID=A0A6A6E6G4_9PEZI|nr:hypothetical protein K469DRAFT_749672 [Zopfia rhizophila CBS 207.26]